MKLIFAKILMRVVGTLFGLLGVGMLCITSLLLYYSITEWDDWMIPLTIFPLAISFYFIYVAYLVWFNFSPLAVRHICGALGLYLLTLVPKLFKPLDDAEAAWPAFAFFGCLVIVYSGLRVASSRLSRWLFPKSVSGVHDISIVE